MLVKLGETRAREMNDEREPWCDGERVGVRDLFIVWQQIRSSWCRSAGRLSLSLHKQPTLESSKEEAYTKRV